MGDLKPFQNYLEDLRSKANNLTETGLALDALFAREEARLNREDEASSLREVYRTVLEQVQRLREIELLASCDQSRVKLILSMTELAVTAIVSRGKLSAITDCLLRGSAYKQQSVGLVMVSIGPEGLPDDVRSISVSRLARESNQSEEEIISRLNDDGYLLMSEDSFSSLISRLMGDIREGKLHLPVSGDRLAQITESNQQTLSPKIIRLT